MTDRAGAGRGERTAKQPGLQNERTALAWQRTALSLVAGAAAITRLTYGELGIASLLCIGCAFVLGSVLFWTSRKRYQHRDRMAANRSCGRDAALTSLLVLVLAVTELIAVAVR